MSPNVATSVILIDSTECPVSRPSNSFLQRVLYSGYKKMTTLKYQVFLSCSGIPIQWGGPCAGPTSDIKMFRRYFKN